jgi:hypothetical protein
MGMDNRTKFSSNPIKRKKVLIHQFNATEVTSTEKAILLDVEDYGEIWFPRQMVTWVHKGTYECSPSFAKEKGILE